MHVVEHVILRVARHQMQHVEQQHRGTRRERGLRQILSVDDGIAAEAMRARRHARTKLDAAKLDVERRRRPARRPSSRAESFAGRDGSVSMSP